MIDIGFLFCLNSACHLHFARSLLIWKKIMSKDKDSTTLQEYFISGIVVLFFGLLYLFLSDDFQFGSSKDNPSPTLAVTQTAPQMPTSLNERLIDNDNSYTLLVDETSKQLINNVEKKLTHQENIEAPSSIKNNINDADIASQKVTTLEDIPYIAIDEALLEKSETDLPTEKIPLEEKPPLSTEDELQPTQDQTVTELEMKTDIDKTEVTTEPDTTPAEEEPEKIEENPTVASQEIVSDPNGFVFKLPDGRPVNISKNGFDNNFKQALINGDVGKPIIFDRVFFDSGSSQLKKQSDHQISATAALLNTYKEIRIAIRGHSDNSGSSRQNTMLSLLRSRSMKKALTNLGINPNRIQIEGIGSQEPVATNKTKRGRRNNRRIDLIIKK